MNFFILITYFTLSTIQEFIDDDNYTIAWYDYYDNGERIKERGVAGLYTLKVTGEECSPYTLSQSTSFLFDNTETITYQYKYSTKDESLEQIEYDNCIVKIEQDNFNRLSKYVKTFLNEKGFETSFAYLTAEGTTSNFLTNLVSTITHKYKVSENNLVTFFNENYEYYGNNNIKKQTINSKKNDYVYDGFNRLYRENNENLGFTKIINYDSFGNIINIKKYDYSTTDSLVNESTETFTYVKNRLTKVQRSDGTYIELGGYDGMSNPTIISKYELCENGGGCELQAKQLTYSRNNRLMSYGDVIFGYDHNGTRVLKTQGSKKHVYYVDEGVILKEAITDTSTNSITNIYYYYDCTGICAFKLNNVMYHYIKDLTGNIIAIYNESGTLVARYVYDAWGNHKVYNPTQEDNNPLSVGNINPFRYKGYYYDVETNLFYVTSRYYSPELCRWISPDSIEYLDPQSINGLNLYAYCGNDPVNNVDPTGHAFISALLISIGIGIAVGLAGQLTSDLVTSAINGEWTFSSWEMYLGAGLGGALAGALFAVGAGGFVTGALSGGLTAFVGNGLEMAHGKQDIDIAGLLVNTFAEALIGGITGSLINVKRINAGRSSLQKSFKIGLSAVKKGNKMSINTFTKGVALNAYTSYGTFMYSVVKKYLESQGWI